MAHSQYKCLFCKAEIPMEDINVSTDIALCRACGKTSAFSVIGGTAQVDMSAFERQPRCVRLEHRPDGGLEIAYRRLSPVLLFLIPFTALWSGGSMTGIYIVPLLKGRLDVSNMLFGLPFLFGTVILLSVIAYMLFGRWRVSMRDGHGEVFAGIGSLGWTRRFDYSADTIVSLKKSKVSVNEVPQDGICVRTGSEELVFGALFKDDAKRFIAAAIAKELQGGKSRFAGFDLRHGGNSHLMLCGLGALAFAGVALAAALFLLPVFQNALSGSSPIKGFHWNGAIKPKKLDDGCAVLKAEPDKLPRLQSDCLYKPPLSIKVEAKTDTNNLRVYYGKGVFVFAWEKDPSKLRSLDIVDKKVKDVPNVSFEPGKWHEILVDVGESALSVKLDGKTVLERSGDYKGVEAPVGIGPAFGSEITVKSISMESKATAKPDAW